LGFIFLWKIPMLKGGGRSNRFSHKLSILIPARNEERTMNLQLLASVKGTVQGAIERRALLACIPQRLIKLLGPSAGSWEQWDTLLGDPQIAGPGASAVDFLHRFPKGFAAGRRPTATEQNVPAYTIFGVFSSY
jgi:hypothetical protein